jgi:alkanesulfonate monooxygenase SsuD/methylene tetrahydromethanopterin reductase-like flavin-dependent oxidoreductase (luciferase family)
MHGDPALKIYTGTIAPAGMAMSAEVADGMFPFCMSPDKAELMAPHLEAGFAKAGGGKSLETYDILPFVRVQMGDDLDECRMPIKQQLALYIGGMGARDKNFYNDYAKRLGYEEAAVKIQDAFLGGQRAEAVAAVPDALVNEVSLVGSKERITERLAVWKAAAAERRVDTLLMSGATPETLRVLAEAVL